MKNFDELYKTLSNISTEKIDIARKKLLIKTAIGIPLAILFVIIGTYFVPGFTFFFIIIAIIMFTFRFYCSYRKNRLYVSRI